jgi:hypothetical protein
VAVAKDDLGEVRDVLRQVHRLMLDRQGSISSVLGVTDAWHQGPSPSWPLVVVDEAHTFFHERKGTSPEVKAHNAVVAELSRLVEELVRKGRNVAISFATRTMDGAVAALGEEIRQHPDASPVLLNDPAYVGVAVTSLPGRPGFVGCGRRRWTTTMSPPSSGPPPGCGPTRPSCWPAKHPGCGSWPRCQLLGRSHDRAGPGGGAAPGRAR